MADEQALFTVLIHHRTKEAVVRPPCCTATKGNKAGILIKNLTDERIWVKIPAGVTESQTAGKQDPVIVHEIASKCERTLPVHAKAGEGVYSFPIFCEQTFSNAQANSDPEFIIQ